MKRIGVVTVGRSDYGIYRPLLDAIQREPTFELQLFVGGMHLSARYGATVSDIERDGYPIGARVEHLVDGDTPAAVSESIGRGVIGFSQAYERARPDLLFVLGDRFEMFAATVAAVPFLIPVAHIHGGELTEGAIDDAFRHSMTKLSHLHFVSTGEYAERVRQLGEEPERIFVCGALGLEALMRTKRLSKPEFEVRYGVALHDGYLLVTFHPVTREFLDSERHVEALLSALIDIGRPVLFTLPNADTGGGVIRERILKAVSEQALWSAVENLGSEGYASAMSMAAAMVGNSSSGLIEALHFALPVVDVGDRQRGRLKPANVVSVACDREEIVGGILRATSPAFVNAICSIANPYGGGDAAARIVDVIRRVAPGPEITMKRFHDLAGEAGAALGHQEKGWRHD